MKTKLGASLIAALMMMGLFGVVGATADPGPNGNNDKGLCTAYFNGQKNGHDKHGSPGPFGALEDAADEEDGEDGANSGDSLETAADVFAYCDGLIGGNPEHGRFDCGYNDDGDPECTRNPEPGNSGNKP